MAGRPNPQSSSKVGRARRKTLRKTCTEVNSGGREGQGDSGRQERVQLLRLPGGSQDGSRDRCHGTLVAPGSLGGRRKSQRFLVRAAHRRVAGGGGLRVGSRHSPRSPFWNLIVDAASRTWRRLDGSARGRSLFFRGRETHVAETRENGCREVV